MIFLLVPNSYVRRNYIPKWNNMFVGWELVAVAVMSNLAGLAK
jgi:hypothetical protein